MIHSFLVAVSIFATVGLAREPQEGFNYNMFLPVGSGAVNEANPWSPPGIISPDAPEGTKLGEIKEECVGGSAENGGVITGVDIIYAVGDRRDKEYCITGFEGHGCIGACVYVYPTKISGLGSLYLYYQESLRHNYNYTTNPADFESHSFDFQPFPKAVTIVEGECPNYCADSRDFENMT